MTVKYAWQKQAGKRCTLLAEGETIHSFCIPTTSTATQDMLSQHTSNYSVCGISLPATLVWVLVWVFCGGLSHIVAYPATLDSSGSRAGLQQWNQVHAIIPILMFVQSNLSWARHGPLLPKSYTAKPSITDTRSMLRPYSRGLSRSIMILVPMKTEHRHDLLF